MELYQSNLRFSEEQDKASLSPLLFALLIEALTAAVHQNNDETRIKTIHETVYMQYQLSFYTYWLIFQNII